MRVRRTLTATLLVLAVCACDDDSRTTPTPTPTAAPGTPPIAFAECGDLVDVSGLELPADRAERLTFECGTLDVPLDHDEPEGERLAIEVVRIRDAAQTDRIGSLVMNPGGPGQQGLRYAPFWATWLPDEILQRFDIVTFDPRGAGASAGFNCPAIPGDSEPEVYPDVASPDGYALAVTISRRQMESCVDELGADRARTSTPLRPLGTWTCCARRWATRRSPISASRTARSSAPSTHDSSPTGSAPWCWMLPRTRTSARSGSPSGRWRASSTPSRAGSTDAPTDLPAIGWAATSALLVAEQSWSYLDDALARAALGDSGNLHEAIDNWYGRVDDPAEPETMDAQLVINCNDAAPGPPRRVIRSVARRLAEQYPVYGQYGAGWLLGCKYWAVERHVLPTPSAPTAPPIVVVGTRHDPATPYAGAVALAKVLGSGHLLTWEGETHTACGQTDCLTEAVDAYLVDLVVPEDGTVCPA